MNKRQLVELLSPNVRIDIVGDSIKISSIDNPKIWIAESNAPALTTCIRLLIEQALTIQEG